MFKQTVLFFTLLFVAVGSIISQDVMTKHDGTELEVKVIEITDDYIKYKLFDNLDGPLYNIDKSKVFMIKYENGSKDVFAKEEKKTTPTERKVIYSKVEYKRKVVDREFTSLIKVNPLLILNGDIPIYYEHRLNDKLSYEVGLGVTQSDYLYEYYTGSLLYDSNNEQHTPEIGYSMRASLRFYPSNYTRALDEFYIGPEIKLRRYNFILDKCSGISVNPQDEYRTFTDFKISGGYILYITDKIFFDMYGGIGLRRRVENRAECEFNGIEFITTPPVIEKATLPAISLGVKVGFEI